MKLFSVEEANMLLPTVRGFVAAIQRAHRHMTARQEAARLAAEGAQLGGGAMQGGEKYVAALMSLAENVGQLEALGVQMKDYTRGLIDFPSMRDGQVVLLCWQMGEGDTLAWWHEIEAGFAGRQPL
ncbi:MAG TPA: DUF2203 domain-containing protein [Pyrinomonadaceae bacterium]|jgi:hypothetical protein|nr:DUF2203 domain-containing protein [Pyrinomonadaceae bacterium]